MSVYFFGVVAASNIDSYIDIIKANGSNNLSPFARFNHVTDVKRATMGGSGGSVSPNGCI